MGRVKPTHYSSSPRKIRVMSRFDPAFISLRREISVIKEVPDEEIL